MKPHLPKKLTAALLAACAACALNTTAAAADTGTATFTGGTTYERGTQIGDLYLSKEMTTGNASSSTLSLDQAVNIWGGNVWAGNYTVSLWVSKDSLDENCLLFAYSGSMPTNPQGANGIYWNAGDQTIKIGQGSVADNYNGFNFYGSNYKVSQPITLGDENEMVNFTFAVARNNSNGQMLPDIWVNGDKVETLAGYPGGMNGSQSTITLYVNPSTNVTYGNVSVTNQQLTDETAIYALMGVSTVAPTADDYVWKSADSSAWDGTTKNWVTKKDGETPVAFVSNADNTVTFGAEGTQKNVTLSIAATVDSVTVSDSYHITVDNDASLTTNALNITAGTSTIDGTGTLALNTLSVANGSTLNIGLGLNLGTVALATSDTPSLHVVNGGTLTISNASTIGGKSLQSENSNAFTQLFQGKAVDVQGTGKLVISGDINTVDRNQGNQAYASGLSNLEILGNAKINTWAATNTTYNLGNHSIKTTGDLWLVTKQTLNIAEGGNLEVGGKLKLGHDSNTGANSSHLVATNANITLGGIGMYGPNNSVSITGGNLTFNTEDATANVLSKAGGGNLANDPISLSGVTLHSGSNGWTLGVVDSAAVSVTGATTLDIAEGKTITLQGANTDTTFNFGSSAGTLKLIGGSIAKTIEVTGSASLVLEGTIAIDNLTGSGITEDYVNVSGEKADNGFHRISGEMTIYTGANVTNSATYTIGDEEVTVTGGKCPIEPTVTYTTLYVNKGSEGFAAYKAAAETAGSALTHVNLANNTTLTADAEGASFVLAIDGNATVNATQAATVTALTGTGKLIVDGTQKVTVQSISGYSGTYGVNTGATLEFTSSNMASLGDLTVDGEGTVRLVATAMSESGNALGTITAKNVKLADNGNHTARYFYGSSSDLSSVEHLYFDGGQLWLGNKELTLNGAVTFNACTYTGDTSGTLRNAAIRAGHDATFSGAVEIAQDTKLTWDNDRNGTTTITFGGEVTGSGNLTLERFRGTGVFTVSGDASQYTGALTATNTNVSVNVAEGAKLTLGSGSNIATAVTLGADSVLTMGGEEASTISGVISGAGSLVKEGAGTLTLSGENTYTGDTVVKGGTLDIQGSISDQSKVKVAQDATIAGDTSNISVGIEAGQTATFTDDAGFTPKNSEVTFISESNGVQVQNIGETEIIYGIAEKDAQVTADELIAVGEGNPIEVNNKVVVSSVANMGATPLTLTQVDTQALQNVDALGDVTLKNVSSVDLTTMTIAPEATVAVYTDETAAIEGTVTITDSLMAGGGTLNANLTLKGHQIVEDGDQLVSWDLNGTTMTLGSTLTLDTADGLIQLDDTTMQAIASLKVGETWELVLNGGAGLVYEGSEWFDGVFSRAYNTTAGAQETLGGDYNVMLLDDGNFGIVKTSKVPEPTTGTLSLLALAALAARRRRK